VEMMMMTSREACVNYMMPLGLHHIFKFDHHYGPEPDGFIASYHGIVIKDGKKVMQ
jgi:alpha-glucuronidase